METRIQIGCAILACILAGYGALELMPANVWGRTAAFAIFMITLYPVDRLMKSTRDRPWWHHWFGSAVGVVLYWVLFTVVGSGVIADEMNTMLNMVIGAFVIGSLVWYYVRRGRRRSANS
jgi:uncharacterized membrane-anchored protein